MIGNRKNLLDNFMLVFVVAFDDGARFCVSSECVKNRFPRFIFTRDLSIGDHIRNVNHEGYFGWKTRKRYSTPILILSEMGDGRTTAPEHIQSKIQQ